MEVELKKWLGRAILPCAVMAALVGCEQKNKEEKVPPVGEKITPMQPATPEHSPAREQNSPGAYPHSFKPKAQPNVSPSASGTRMEI